MIIFYYQYYTLFYWDCKDFIHAVLTGIYKRDILKHIPKEGEDDALEYQEVLNYIGGSEKFGKKLGLWKMRRLMELLGNPQDTLRFVHIAGTNGKGSTAAFLSEILISAGYCTGLYTSPFLYEFNERMRINGTMIADDALCKVVERVKLAADVMEMYEEEYPTEFELITAAAFCYFAERKCDIVVLETGLGGRFDATNIIRTPEVSVITPIGLDHTQFLGNTIGEVAFEKSGIIKDNGYCVCCGLQQPEAFSVIERTAKEKNCVLITWDEGKISDSRVSEKGNQFTYRGVDYRTQLRGEYQIHNALTAITSAQILQQNGWNIEQSEIVQGIAKAQWSGRMDTLSEKPFIIADGSHNPDGMRAFVRSAERIAGDKKIVCIVAMMKDKDCKSCLRELSKITKSIILTTLPFPRAAGAESMAELAQEFFDEINTTKNCEEALNLAVQKAGKNGCVYVLGSLYLIGEAKKILDQKRDNWK